MSVPKHLCECPECGISGWMAKDHERMRRDAVRTREDADKLARENGLLRYQLARAEADMKDQHSYLAGKVDRQRKTIKRLEERLRAAGKRPYEQTDVPS